MKKIKKYVSLYGAYSTQYIKALLQSKVDLILGLLGFLLVQWSGIMFVYLVFANINNINGWSLNQIIFVYGFSQLARGIDHFFTDNLWSLAWGQVINGEFDKYMLRPVNLLFQVISEKIQPDALGELIIGFYLIYKTFTNGLLNINVKFCIAFIISVIAGSMIYTSIKIIYSSLAFWLKISGPILYTTYETSDFSKYPIDIYNGIIKFIISYLIPFAFVSYYPATYLLGMDNFISTIGLECLVAIIFFTLSIFIFNLGINHYESVGN